MTLGRDPDDMAIWYDADGVGTQCAKVVEGGDDLPFVGIVGTADELVLEGYAVTAENSLRYPSDAVDLDEGDVVIVGAERDDEGTVVLVDGDAQGGKRYRVRTEPRLINDGAETGALINPVQA